MLEDLLELALCRAPLLLLRVHVAEDGPHVRVLGLHGDHLLQPLVRLLQPPALLRDAPEAQVRCSSASAQRSSRRGGIGTVDVVRVVRDDLLVDILRLARVAEVLVQPRDIVLRRHAIERPCADQSEQSTSKHPGRWERWRDDDDDAVDSGGPLSFMTFSYASRALSYCSAESSEYFEAGTGAKQERRTKEVVEDADVVPELGRNFGALALLQQVDRSLVGCERANQTRGREGILWRVPARACAGCCSRTCASSIHASTSFGRCSVTRFRN